MQKILAKISSIDAAWWWSVFALYLLLVGVSWFPTSDGDVLMYLAIARRFFNEGRFPGEDPFIFSIDDYHWTIMHQWLGYFPWYGWTKAFGIDGLVSLKVILLSFIFSIPLIIARYFGNKSYSTFLILTLGLGAATLRLSERTSLFSELLQATLIAILVIGLTGKRKVLRVLPLLFVFWVNLHPGFHPGIAIFLIALMCFTRFPLDDDGREFIFLFVLSVAATFFNPRGWDGFIYPLQTVASNKWDIMRFYNLEWLPTYREPFRSTFAVGCWSFLILLSVSICVWSWRTRRTDDIRFWLWSVLTTLFLIIYGSSSSRFVTVASYSLVTLMISVISRNVRPANAFQPLASWLTPVTIIFLATWVLVFGSNVNGIPRKVGSGLDGRVFPVDAARWYLSHQQPTGNIWNEHGFGAYLAFAWDGNPPIFYHGFMDDMIFYGHNYVNVALSRSEFDRVVSEFNIKTFFVRTVDLSKPNFPSLYKFLLRESAFKLVYHDQVAMIFIRP